MKETYLQGLTMYNQEVVMWSNVTFKIHPASHDSLTFSASIKMV